MKAILIILMITYNAFCMGQEVDKIDSVTIDSDTSHLFQYYKSGKVDTFELEKPKVLRPTIKHNYMLFDEMGKDTIPKQDTVWVHTGTNDSMIWRGGGSGEMAEIKTRNEEPVYHRKKDTVLVNCLVSKEEKNQHCGTVYAVQLYSVRELHDINEDGDFPPMPSGNFEMVRTYWEHVYFLELSKEPISENLIIWQTKEVNN